MIKLLAGSLILIASILFSFSLSKRKRQEEEFVKGYIDFINYLSSELIFYKREMKEIFNNYVKDHLGLFVDYIKDKYVNKEGKKSYIDSNIIDENIKQLNELDVKSQEKFLKYCSEEAEKLLEKRVESTKYYNTLTKKLVPLVGLVIFIIII